MKQDDEFLLKARGGRAAMISQQVSADKPSSSSDGSDEPPEPDFGDGTLAADLNAQVPSEPKEELPKPTDVGIQIGFQDDGVAMLITTTAGQVMAKLSVDQARSMAANLAQACDTLMPNQATIFVVTEKLSWTLPGQAISFRYDLKTRQWQSGWQVSHKVVAKPNGKSELKRSTALLLPPGVRN
jgi:hypothetical protein